MAGIEASNETPKDPTQVMGDFMPPKSDQLMGAEVSVEKDKIDDKWLDKWVGKPRTELKPSDYEDFINEAKENWYRAKGRRKIPHGETINFTLDGVKHVYLYDNYENKNQERFFRIDK